MKQTGQTWNKKQILWAVILGLALCFVFALVYKAQLAEKFTKPVFATLKIEHKDNGQVEMSANNPVIVEAFECTVPDLQVLYVETVGVISNPDAMLHITVSDADTGKIYYEKDRPAKGAEKKNKKKRIRVGIWDDPVFKESEGKRLVLTMELQNPGDTVFYVNADQKPGLVAMFGGDPANKTNVISGMKYASCWKLRSMYAVLCLALFIFFELMYMLIVVKKLPVLKFYIPMALLLGMIMNVVIAPHGVPDEPWHIDTAYKYSNRMMFAGDTGIEGTIYKRTCDVKMEDMLANGVESNSYYQLAHHTFERPDDQELIAVPYVDSSNIVPGIFFIPMAFGITIGRLLGLSTMLMLLIGRFMNLLVFVLLTGFAIRILPVGKNMLAALGFLPIALQQGASASYDAMINGIIYVFIALCMSLSLEKTYKKWQVVLLVLCGILTAVVKGGVYLPLLLLVFLLIHAKRKEHSLKVMPKHKKGMLITAVICGIIIVFCGALYYYFPVIKQLFAGQDTAVTEDTLYSLGYLLCHPLNVVYLYWNTLINGGETLLRGFFGGLLSWLDIKISWVLLLVLVFSLVLFANVEGDKYCGNKKKRIYMFAVFLISLVLILLSMLVAFTSISSSKISGVQGRYFLCIAPLLCMATTTSLVNVSEEKCRKVWMTVIATEILIVLQIVVGAM